jgi:hypothetical protein
MISNVVDTTPVLKKRKTLKAVVPEKLELSYKNYKNQSFNLKSYKLPELKSYLKSKKLAISGTKPMLMERIESFFTKTDKSVLIQACFRGFIVREIIKLRGPAKANRYLCVNDTDFVTMDRISEIPDSNFFSFSDKQSFIYGFDILSLMQSLKTNNNENPYNRERFDNSIIKNIKSYYNKSCLLYPEIKLPNAEAPKTNTFSAPNRSSRYQNSTNVNRANNVNNMNEVSINRYNMITAIRNKPILQRMQDLFIQIDQLGNYTQVAWFSNLNLNQYIRLYRALYEIWNYRGGLSRETKLKICPFYGPFERIFQTPIYYDELTLAQIQGACTSVFETLVFSGIDDDNRKLGTFHALSALTIVSSGARQAMPWLYESIAY